MRSPQCWRSSSSCCSGAGSRRRTSTRSRAATSERGAADPHSSPQQPPGMPERAGRDLGLSRNQALLLVVALLALALNLRPAAVSVGPVLDEVRVGLGMSKVTAGILTT